MPFRSWLADLRDCLSVQRSGDLPVLAEMAVGDRGIIRPQHQSVGGVHHEAHDLLRSRELPEPLSAGRSRAGGRRKEFGGNA